MEAFKSFMLVIGGITLIAVSCAPQQKDVALATQQSEWRDLGGELHYRDLPDHGLRCYRSVAGNNRGGLWCKDLTP